MITEIVVFFIGLIMAVFGGKALVRRFKNRGGAPGKYIRRDSPSEREIENIDKKTEELKERQEELDEVYQDLQEKSKNLKSKKDLLDDDARKTDDRLLKTHDSSGDSSPDEPDDDIVALLRSKSSD